MAVEKATVTEKEKSATPASAGSEADKKASDSKSEREKSTSTAESAKNLSNQATKPGDAQALQSAGAKPKGDVVPLLGKVEITEKKEPKQLNPAAVRKAADDIQEATFNRAMWGWGWSKPDPEKVRNILEPMNAADRKRVEDLYAKNNPGHTLRGDLKEKLGASSEDFLKLESILNRKDNKSDETGQVHLALNKLEQAAARQDSRSGAINWVLGRVNPGMELINKYQDAQDNIHRNNAEADIRKSIGALTSSQIKELKETYAANYKDKDGRPIDLEKKLLSDPKLSQASKDALQILFKGIDKRTGNDPESVQNSLKLAQIGLNSRNIDIFKDAMQVAPTEARKQFERNGGYQQINKAFSGDDKAMAQSYADQGAGNLAYLVEGNNHWYHTNRDEITRLVTHQASDIDRQRFTKGKELSDKNTQPTNEEERKSLDFYKKMHAGLVAAGSPREVAIWENKLMKSESVIAQALESHKEANFLGFGKNTDRDKLFSSVENMSKEDWTKFKANPDPELRKFQKALDTFASGQDSSTLIAMVREKLTAESYEKSQVLGRRPADQTYQDNKTSPGARLERIFTMTESERQDYKDNKGVIQERLNKAVEANTHPASAERFAAQRLLKEMAEGKKPDGVDKALLSSLKGENPSATVKAIETAIKENPALLKQPLNDADSKAIGRLRDALNTVVERAGYGDQVIASEFSYTTIPGRQNEFAQQLFKTGTMPLELKADLNRNDQAARFNDILNASEQDKARLLNPNPDKETKRFQDAVLGTKEDREILAFALKQGKLTEADQFRAFVQGKQKTPEELKDVLMKMTPEQRQDLANEYFTKYKTLISTDVIDKVPAQEKFRFRELLAPTETHVRQVVLNAREERDKHSSPADALMSKMWDKSKLGADEAQAKLDKFVKEHANEIEKLTPEQKKAFNDAVANYQSALKNYVESKGAFAETLVDAAITVTAIGGAIFTGGTSLALLGAIGVGGAGFRVAAMKALQGTDFNDSAENVFRQAFKGFVAAELGFIGPQQLGFNGLTKLGAGVALKSSENVVAKMAQVGVAGSLFKGSTEATQQLIAKELVTLSRQAAMIGGKESEAIVQRVSAAVLKDGAAPAERAIFEQAIRNEVKEQVVTGIRNKLITGGEEYLLNVAAATTGSVGAEVAATVVGLEDFKTLWDRAAGSAVAGLGGVTVFHFAFKGTAASFKGARALLGKDSNGLFAGEGTIIRHADGSTTEVANGQKYRFKDGDKVVQDLNTVKPQVKREGAKEGGDTARPVQQGERPAEKPLKQDDATRQRGATESDTAAGKKLDEIPKVTRLDTPDGRPSDTGRKEFIQEKFKHLNEAERAKAREAVIHDLKEVKASATAKGTDGKPLSAYEKLMADPNMSPEQKNRVLDLLADVREHYASYRTPDGKMLPDQEVNWIHTQGELAKVIESAQANKLTGIETENALIASMFSDSAKFTDTALTKGNFATHHLDGALAAAEALQRRGVPADRINAITQAIREHQIAPPEFMGMIYHMTISGTLKGKLASGAIDQAKFDQMKKVLDDMTVVGPDNMPRIKQIADVNNAPRVRNDKGEWEVAFSPEQRELMRLTGNDTWYVPHDPRYAADGKTLDTEFQRLSPAEQAEKISAYKSSRALIDGDGIDNYATVGGASKIVKIRGPETPFKDKTVWNSVESVDTSFNDALKVMTPEGQRIAQESLADRNRILKNNETGIKAQMDDWLRGKGKDPSKDSIPFYNSDLKYPETTPADAARIKELQGVTPANPAEKAAIDAELRSLKYKGLTEQQIADFEFAKQIRDQMTDFMRMGHRTDGSLPGRFESSVGARVEPPKNESISTTEASRIQKGEYRPRIAAPTDAELAALNKQLPQLGKDVAEDFSKVVSNVRESWADNLAPKVNRANDLAPQVDGAHKQLQAELAKVKASEAEINAARIDPKHPLNQQAKIHEAFTKWKTVADEHAALNLEINNVTNARAKQLQTALDQFTTKHKLPPVKVALSENMHATGGYTFGEGKITLPRTALVEAGGAANLNKVTFHEFTHAAGQDSLLVRDAMRKAAQEGRATDSARVKDLYKEATGRELQDDWLKTVKNSAENKPAMTDAEIKRAGDLAKSVKDSLTDVARRSEEFGNTARVLDSKLQDLRANADGKAVDRAFEDILSNSSDNKLATRMFGMSAPSDDLVKAARDWTLAREGKLDGPFDQEKARQLLIAHLEPELARVNAAHKNLIDTYAGNQIEREAYALSHQTNDPATIAGRDTSEPSAIRARKESANEPGDRARLAPMNEAIDEKTEQIRKNAIKAMDQKRPDILLANRQHVAEVMRQRAKEGLTGKPGEAHQEDIYKTMQRRLEQLQKEGKVSRDWQVEPGLIGGAADNAKADFMLVNKETGEIHILDATANEVKINNENNRLSPIRERGIIPFDPKAFDVRASADDVASTVAMTNLEKKIDEVFVDLSKTPSPLVLGDTPFPPNYTKGDTKSQIEDLKRLKDWIESKPNDPDLRAYAAELKGGITWLENQLKVKAASSVMNDNLSSIADRLNVRLAVKAIQDKHTPPALRNRDQHPTKAPDKTTNVHLKAANGDKPIATIQHNGANYPIDPVKIVKESAHRLSVNNDKPILSEKELKSLRKLPGFKEKSDDELNKMVKQQIMESGKLAGSRIGHNGPLILVDDFVGTLRNTDPDRILLPKSETAPSPDATTKGNKQVEADPVIKYAGEVGVKPPEVDGLITDTKSMWNHYDMPTKLDGVPKQDVIAVFDSVIEAKGESWTPTQKAYMEKLRAAYENDDPAAADFLARVLK
ncbi:MAG: hypothetical protein K2X77_33290 [Candidatus Obscuribacterales bacterium]|jgi:uncharacterized protein YneR|nr:hypothetical protein [Candidatus Obscuribacterales bacterium]